MGEDEQEAQRTEQTDSGGHTAGESGWTTTDTAARALGVSPRSVRRFIDRGELEGRKTKEGRVESWEVSINSLYALRDKRMVEGQPERRDRRDVPRESGRSQVSSDMTDLVRDLTSEAIRHSSEAAGLRARLELTEQTQSTLEAVLAEERRRREEAERKREQAERERDELRGRLEALQEPLGAVESDEGEHYGSYTPQEAEESQEPSQRRN